jgi:hypothetical protein
MPKQITQNQWLPTIASIAVGAIVWFIFESAISTSGLTSGFSYWWAGYAIMFLAAGLLGYLFSQRPWRWGIYIIIAHVVVASLRSKGDHSMLPLELIFFGFLAVLFVLASYLGAWLSRKLGQQT